MPFGAVIIGSPGAGKSTLCAGYQQVRLLDAWNPRTRPDELTVPIRARSTMLRRESRPGSDGPTV